MKRKACDLKVKTDEDDDYMDVVDDVTDISRADEMDELVEMMSVSSCHVGVEEIMMLYDSGEYVYDATTVATKIADAGRRWRRYLFKLRSVYGCEAKRAIEKGLQCIWDDAVPNVDKWERVKAVDGLVLCEVDRMMGGLRSKKQRVSG
jgi:hypothetical protein